MIRMKRYGFVLACLFVAASGGRLLAQGDEGTTKEVAPEQRLRDVQALIDGLQEEIQRTSGKYVRARQELVNTDGAIGALYSEVRDLEKLLNTKRKELSRRLQEHPELKKLTDQRAEMYRKLNELKERERLINNELRAKKYRSETKQE